MNPSPAPATSFWYIPVASPLHDARSLSALLAGHEQALVGAGGHRGVGEVADAPGVPFYFVQTGGTEHDVLRRHRSRIQQGRGGPLLLIAHPGHNSLPAALEMLAAIQQEGRPGRIFLLKGKEDDRTLAEITQTARALAANNRLAQDRFGIIGPSADWLVASSPRAELVARRFGMWVKEFAVDELRAYIAQQPLPEDGPEFDLWDRAHGKDGLTREAFAQAVRVTRGLRALVQNHQLSMLTLRCFDLVEKDGVTGCLALALLADAGITAGCEGDIPSAVLLRWLWHLTGQAGWMANPSDVDVPKGELLLAHCTVPLGMVGGYRFRTHFESGIGLGIAGEFASGPVTLLRLGGSNLDRWWGAEGTLVENRRAPDLCRTQVVVRVSPPAAGELLSAPLGNHLVLVRGHVQGLFREAFIWSTPGRGA